MDKFTDEATLNDVLSVLKKENFPEHTQPQVVSEPIDNMLNDITEPEKTDEDFMKELDGEFTSLLKKISQSINNNSAILEEAALLVKTVGDDKTLEAYASVAKSNSELLKTFATTVLERQKMIAAEKMKNKDLALKKELAKLKNSGNDSNPKLPAGQTYIQNNFTLKASRDEMFDMIFGNADEKKKAVEAVVGNNPDTPLLEAQAEVVERK